MSTVEPESPTPATGKYDDHMRSVARRLLVAIIMGCVGGALWLGILAAGLAAIVGEDLLLPVLCASTAGAILGTAYGALYGVLGAALLERFRASKAKGPTWRRCLILVHVLCLGAVTALAWHLLSGAASATPSLPEPSEVASMTGTIFPGLNSGKTVNFAVPAEHIPRILASMTPATRERAPRKWVGWADLKILCKDGRSMTVHVYVTHRVVGAFRIDEDGRASGSFLMPNYFRAGEEQAIHAAITDAYESSGKK